MHLEISLYSFMLLAVSDGSLPPVSYVNSTTNLSEGNTAVPFPQRQRCVYAPGLVPGNDGGIEECCNIYYNYHRRNWFVNNRYLSSLLQSLKLWNCSIYREECQKRSFAYTQFGKLMYDRYCDPAELTRKCENTVASRLFIDSTRPLGTENDSMEDEKDTWKAWEKLVYSGNFSVQDQLNEPCVQIAMFDSKYGGYGNYHEIGNIMIPFCGFTQCGYVGKTLLEEKISSWNCISERCRVNNVVAMVFIGILSAVVLVANITVLHVMAHYSHLRNSQTYYKISLAVADLLVGLIIFPTFISSTTLKLFSVHSLGKVESVPGYLANETAFDRYVHGTVDVRVQGTRTFDSLTKPYLNFVGFITTVSLVVSVYTLMAASFDRFWVVFRPMSFDKGKAMRNAKYFTICLWILAILLACLPFFLDGSIKYGLVASILVCFVGSESVILYLIAFLIPLVIVWCTTGATYCISMKQARHRRKLTQQSESAKLKEMEWRLTKTLTVMVLAFTLSLLPVVLVLVVSASSPYVNPFNPTRLHPASVTALVSMEYVANVMLMCNSLWNCIVYNLRNKEFNAATKQSYRNLLRAIGLSCLVKTSLDEHASNRTTTTTLKSVMQERISSNGGTTTTNA